MPEDDPFDVVGPKFARRRVVGLAVLLSTLMISVMCGPLWRHYLLSLEERLGVHLSAIDSDYDHRKCVMIV